MRTIYLDTKDPFILGKTGESNRTALRVNVESWYNEYPGGNGVVLFMRPNKVIFPLETNLIEYNGEHYLEAIITSNETKLAGFTVVTAQWYDGETLVHGLTFSGKILVSAGNKATDGVEETTPTWVSELIIRLNIINETEATVQEAYAKVQHAVESIDEAIQTADETVQRAQDAADAAEASKETAGTYKTAAAASATAAATSAEHAMDATPEGYAAFVGSMAPAYSTAQAYAVGDLVMKDGQLYRCVTAIGEDGEAWTAGHWTAVTVGGEVGNLKTAIDTTNIYNNPLTPYYLTFERITLSQTGVWGASTTRIGCRHIFHTDEQIFIRAADGYKLAYAVYNSEGVYQTIASWKTGCYYIAAGTYFSVVLAHSDDSAIYTDEAVNLYFASMYDDGRKLLQAAPVYGTSGTMSDPTVVKSGTNLVVTIPTRMLVLGYDFTIYIKDFAEVQTITVSHNEILYYDFATETINKISYANLKSVFGKIFILLYNNNGKPIGEFEKYYDSDLKSIKGVTIIADQNGENAIGVSNSSSSSETITVIVPTRCIVLGYSNSVDTIDKSSISRFDVPHNSVLYYDFVNAQFNVKPYTQYASITNDRVLLLYNNHGRAIGQWAKYQNAVCSTDNFKTTIFCSRQGDIDGCPENSLVGIKRAKTFGYNRVRVSVSFTSDGVPVCFHDEYLGTNGIVYDANGDVVTDVTKKINEYTYSELQTYDFGLYKGDGYKNTAIMTLESAIILCRNLGCELDIEIKYGWNSTNVVDAYKMVALNGMIKHVMFIGYGSNSTLLEDIIDVNDTVSVGYADVVSTEAINTAIALKTGKNDVWFVLLSTDYTNLTDELRLLAVNNGIRFKYCSIYNLTTISADVMKCDMVEIAYMKYPAFYAMKGN